jgi:hypothetical protein
MLATANPLHWVKDELIKILSLIVFFFAAKKHSTLQSLASSKWIGIIYPAG